MSGHVYIGGYRKGKSWLVSPLIRKWSWSKYHHVSVILSDGTTYQAQARYGVTKQKSYHDLHKPGVVIDLFRFEMTSGEKKRFIDYLESRIGNKYDYHGILGFLSRRDGAHNEERDFCSEYAVDASIAAKKPLQERVPSNRVSPGWVVASPLLKPAGTLTVGVGMSLLGLQLSDLIERLTCNRSPVIP